jgi:hypothetical protein
MIKKIIKGKGKGKAVQLQAWSGPEGSRKFFFFFCRARWLMPPDVPQPVRLIVLTLL